MILINRVSAVGERHVVCLYKCSCEKRFTARKDHVDAGLTKSCGCFNSRAIRDRLTQHGHKPAGQESPTYSSWSNMIKRCVNPRATQWKWYGGKGVKVCPRWRRFVNFLADMGERPPGKSIDRINPGGDYEPSNCRWASAKEQRANQTKTNAKKISP